MKYAVVKHAGKQFVAAEGQLVEVDRLALQAGSAVEFGEVLLLRDTDHVEVGAPYIQGARVTGKIQAHLRGPKILVFKYRAKQRYRVRQGHRQDLTRVTIESIGLPGASAEAATTTAEPKPQPVEPRRTARKPASSAAKRPAAAPKAKATAQPAAARPKSGARKADKGKQPKADQAAKKPAAQKKSAGSKKK
jgi:large subunit ribosomal protein L21